MSWRVTILACFKSFSRDTRGGRHIRHCQSNKDNLWKELKHPIVTLQFCSNWKSQRHCQNRTSSLTMWFCVDMCDVYFQSTLFKPVHGSSVPSRIAVQGAPSSCSRRISFRATKLSVNLLRPLNTVAYVPCKDRKHVSVFVKWSKMSVWGVCMCLVSFSLIFSVQLTSPSLSSLM